MIEEPLLQELASAFRGELIRPGDDGYDSARRVWNAMIDKRPAVIARCVGAADVIAAVNFGREQGLLVSIRGGGHSVAGNAVCEGGLMIDLSPMKRFGSTLSRRLPARSPASCGESSTAKRRRSVLPPSAAWCQRPALPG